LDQLKAAAAAGRKDPLPLLAIRQLFNEELAGNQRFVQQIEEALVSFYDKGAAMTLEEYVR
jgi:mannitol-1-phosphate/altronate dehydrogenase